MIANSEERLTHTVAYPLSISDHYLVYATKEISDSQSLTKVCGSKKF